MAFLHVLSFRLVFRHVATASLNSPTFIANLVSSEEGKSEDCSRPSEESLIANSDALETRSYKRRFCILAVFSIASFMQYCAWNTFGPISSTCMTVFEWGKREIALMASLDPITYLLTMLIFSWLMDVKGTV